MADLVSSQVLQKTLDELRNITRIDLCVTNTDGVLLVTTFPETAIDAESIRSFVLSAADSQIVQEYHYFKVYDNQNVEYILISKGSSDDAYMIGKVAVCEIQNLIIAYKERLDKNNFIQNLLLDNLLLVDVYNRAKKLRIDTDVRRVVFMVETKMEKDISAQETVKSLFASRPKDFITAVDEKSIIIVKELKDTDTFEDMNQTARMLVDMLNAEAMFSMMDNLFTGIHVLIWMVGLGTLLAGAIGVSNIMMVTVKERTTEIGIRRAIGARPKDILQQILSESMVLTTIAGMAGISFGVLILQLMEIGVNSGKDHYSHFQVSFGMAIGTCLLLVTLGLLAGLAPAYRAMAIRPIEAIRDE